MTNAACQLGGYIICLVSGVMVITAIGLPYWSRDTHSGQIIEAQGYSYGLWWRCIYVSTGAFTCDAYDRIFLGMPAEIQTARALSIVSALIWFIMMIVGVMGLECTVYKKGSTHKSRLSVFAGVGCIISGICIGVAGSMWAYRLVTEFYGFAGGLTMNGGYSSYGAGMNSFGPGAGNIMEPGASVWMAWLACVGLICGGLLLICGSRNPDPEDEGRDYRPYPNDPPRYDTNLRTNGRNNPGYVPDPQPYQPNYNKPSRVYI